jgi:hypothetical protein
VEVTIPVAQWTKMVKCKAASVPKHHAWRCIRDLELKLHASLTC